MEPLTRRQREALRESFRPDNIRLLFIGEAPPASGRFFYSRNSGLYRAMRETFKTVDARIDEENFLSVFQESGCYLIDLCQEPVDRLDPQSRRDARMTSERLLSKSFIELQPERVAILLRAVAGNVTEAASCANWQGEMLELPYPGRWSRHRAEFVKALGPALHELMESSGRRFYAG